MAVCTWEDDIAISWNRPPPPNEGYKWRRVGDKNYCECLSKRWEYKGIQTKWQCSGEARTTSDAPAPTAQCWVRNFDSDEDGSTCTSLYDPNPMPKPKPKYSPPCKTGECCFQGTLHWSKS